MDHARAADELVDMRRTGRVVADLPPLLRPSTLDDAYEVQQALVERLLPESARPIGFKCACTSPIAQAALHVDAPLFGRLLPHTSSPSGAVLPADRFTHRVIEAEFAFRIGSDVPARDTGHTRQSIAEHIDAVLPAIEIVDHRFVSWTVGAPQVAADNAIHGWWVHGDPLTDWRHLDLASAAVEVRRAGDVVTTGSGANVLGHPLAVMAWLADELPVRGLALRTGDLVTTGVTTDVFEAEPGDAIAAAFGGVGEVRLTFT